MKVVVKNRTKGVECRSSLKGTKMKEVHLLLLFLRLGRQKQNRDYAIITADCERDRSCTDGQGGRDPGMLRRIGRYGNSARYARYARGLG